MPIGVWSTSSTRSMRSQPLDRSQPMQAGCAPCARVALATQRMRRFAYSTSRASVDLPDPDTPVTTVSRPSGMRTSTSLQVVQAARRAISSAGVSRVDRSRRGCSGCRSGCARKRPVTESGAAHQVARPCPARPRGRRACPRRGRGRSTWSRAADGVLVVLDHHQRVALGLQLVAACRAGCGCRAGAGRWSARRGCSTRRAGWSPAAPRAGCAAPRRPRAWAPSGRAPGSRGPLRSGKRGASAVSATGRARSRLLARRPASSVREERGELAATGSRGQSAIDCSRKRTASASGFRRLPSQAGQGCVSPSHQSFHRALSSPVCSLVEARASFRPGAEAGRAPAVLAS